jgi:hypothetical protein
MKARKVKKVHAAFNRWAIRAQFPGRGLQVHLMEAADASLFPTVIIKNRN